MHLLSHLFVAASHWPTAIHRRHQATRPWTLTRFHGRFLPSMKCLWHIGCMGSLHTAFCCAPLCVLHSRLSWSMHNHHHQQHQQ